MPMCPLCLRENQPDAYACEHCGRFQFRDSDETDLADIDAVTVQPSRLGNPSELKPAPSTMKELPPKADLSPVAAATQVKLVVIRGVKMNTEFPIYDGPNYLGRTAERPADIDLSGLEPPEQVWSSRQHACIHSESGSLALEDLNSLNGTFVNRARLRSGKRYALKDGDVIQIGTVQLKVVFA